MSATTHSSRSLWRKSSNGGSSSTEVQKQLKDVVKCNDENNGTCNPPSLCWSGREVPLILGWAVSSSFLVAPPPSLLEGGTPPPPPLPSPPRSPPPPFSPWVFAPFPVGSGLGVASLSALALGCAVSPQFLLAVLVWLKVCLLVRLSTRASSQSLP